MDFIGLARRHRFILCFGAILVAKFVLAGLFSSDYQDALFRPFVCGWIKTGGNPYELFAQTQMFPYPPLMLFIESVGGLFSIPFGTGTFLANALFKMPVFAFDILCFVFLAKMFPRKKRQVTVIYFCSPILLYSGYMHGQLDIIPTALLTGSVYFMLSRNRHRDIASSLLVTAALCTKFHILAVLPLFFIFREKRDGWRKALVYGLFIPALGAAAAAAPFWSGGFVKNVLFNREQAVLTQVSLDFASLRIYIPVLAVILIYLRMVVVARVNRELFFGFSAILFSVFLILVPPMPGWYLWILPFLVVFYIDIPSNRRINFLIFSLLNALYAFYFVFAHDTPLTDLSFCGKSLDCLKAGSAAFKNTCFTMLFAVHAYVVYYIYCVALRGNSLYRRQDAPFIIGISGDSGSGKSTLVSIFKNFLGGNNILALECDGDHKWDRSDENWKSYTHLNPVANYLYRQADDIARLRAGRSVLRTEYNHATGRFDGPHKVLPRPYILVAGLHSLYLPQLRRLEDLKIYMDIDEGLRRFWKIRRDVYRRGHPLEDVVGQIEGRMQDFHKYIEPQKEHADLLIRYFDRNLAGGTVKDYEPRLSLKITASNEVDFGPLVSELKKYGIGIAYEFDADMASQSLVFEGCLESSSLPVADIAFAVVPELEYILNQPIAPQTDMWSVIGLVILMMINEKMGKFDSGENK